MISAQLFAMAGMYKIQAYRELFPLLIPLHIIFFSSHMIQEILDIHKGKPIAQRPKME